MIFDPIERLHLRVRGFLNEAVQYHLAMSSLDEDEPRHEVLANEFQAALALLPTLITKEDTFIDHRSLRAVWNALDRFRLNIKESLPMTALLLEQILREISAVKGAAAKREARTR